jgi:predicted nucleic acid-binding protein
LKKALIDVAQPERQIDYLAAASIKAAARKNGSILEHPDCLIASVAVRLNRPLVTGNTQDFQAIQNAGIGLTLENWRRP